VYFSYVEEVILKSDEPENQKAMSIVMNHEQLSNVEQPKNSLEVGFMASVIFDHLEQALMEFSRGDYFLNLLKAKSEYFQLTGTVNEDDEEYEARMNSFNDWYLFQYISPLTQTTIISEYIKKHQLTDQLIKSFTSVIFSLFEFQKKSFKNQIVLEDLIHHKKYVLPIGHEEMALIPKDFFSGRVITYEEEHYLLKGRCILPIDSKSICRKQSKKIHRMNNIQAETEFLLMLEAHKTKWGRYNHVSVDKIFVFDR
jgi:hypothetical protein